MKKSFGAAINCIDGRVQLPVTQWIKENFFVDYVDLITEPGKLLADNVNTEVIKGIKSKLELSLRKHDSKILAVAAHADCASNNVSDDEQLEQLRRSIVLVRSWGLDVEIVGLWVDIDQNVKKYV